MLWYRAEHSKSVNAELFKKAIQNKNKTKGKQ